MRKVPTIAILIPIIVILGFLFVIVVPALTNSVIQSAVVDTIRHDYGVKDNAYVRIDSSMLKLVRGSIDEVYIECPHCGFDGITPKSLVVILHDVKFDVAGTILNKKGSKLKSIREADARIVFDQAGINRYVAEKYPDLKGWPLRLYPNLITAMAKVEMLGKVQVSFVPRITGDRLVLEPQDAKFDDTSTPSNDVVKELRKIGEVAARNWVHEIPIGLPVSNLPFGMKVTKVLVERGQLVVSAGK
ncbi:MAG TPA: DUF2993 domain-containing protein [Candidatus Aquicultor sp.]|jgi:hypothetical protein